MSIDDTEPVANETRRSNTTRVSEGTREALFVGGAILGVAVFALGLAFLIVGVSVGTSPPAPYLQTTLDKVLLIGGSLTAMAAGAGLVRAASTLAGW